MKTLSSTESPVLEVIDLVKHFTVRRMGRFAAHHAVVRAVDGLSFEVGRGETLAVVGESGSGKSTMGRLVAGLMEPTSGSLMLHGRERIGLRGADAALVRRSVQIVFQDPYSSLSPRFTVSDLVAEPLRIQGMRGTDVTTRVNGLLSQVGLPHHFSSRYPHELSGGQRQRVGVARALALDPELLVLDEPVSALDVSVQAQLLRELQRLQAELGLSYVFISHDLSVVRSICDRIAVMYMGVIVETGHRDQVFGSPQHPYTQALLSAVPTVDGQREKHRTPIVLHGDPPSPINPPSGCRFRTRCWKAADLCATEVPSLMDRSGTGQRSACHFPTIVDTRLDASEQR